MWRQNFLSLFCSGTAHGASFSRGLANIPVANGNRLLDFCFVADRRNVYRLRTFHHSRPRNDRRNYCGGHRQPGSASPNGDRFTRRRGGSFSPRRCSGQAKSHLEEKESVSTRLRHSHGRNARMTPILLSGAKKVYGATTSLARRTDSYSNATKQRSRITPMEM